MQTHAAAKQSGSHASKPFFGSRASAAPAFFTPMIQAKCAACEHEPPNVQTKLSIGAPGDRFEQEADVMADTVMRMPVPGTAPVHAADAGARRIQRESTESCAIADEAKEPDEDDEATEDIEPAEAEEETPISPKRESGDVAPPADMESRLDSSRGGGSSLPSHTRDFMETRFGYDFSGVRIHTGAASEGLNRDVRSLAFTSGKDVYFGAGHFQPDTDSGKHLLAHELTHVVQQSGTTGSVVREKSDPGSIACAREKKSYYSGDSWKSGTATHAVIERLLRDHDDQLVTEAPIPGAHRNMSNYNLVGVADLYKSLPEHRVSGVKAYKDADTDERFVNMNNPDYVGTQPAGDQLPRRLPPKNGVRPWDGDFPEKIWLGELKPFSFGKIRGAERQLTFYSHGYDEFVKQAHRVNGGRTRPGISVERLELSIPPYLNFDNWYSEQGKDAKSVNKESKKRLWIAGVGGGKYVYIVLPSDQDASPPEDYFKHLAEMRQKVIKELQEPAKTTARMKFISPATKLAMPRAGTSTRRIQRNTAERGTTYWADRATKWETARSEWGARFRGFTKGGLKRHRYKVRFEKALGRAGRKMRPGEKKEVKEYKQLMFWSGRAGKFLGKIRFLLGGVWDKALAFFEKMHKKMSGIRAKVTGLSETGLVKVGWQAKLIEVLMIVCKAVFSSFITESFNFFARCFESAMDKVIEKFQEEMQEQFGEQICRARKLFEDSKQKLETEWGGVIRQIETVIEAIQNIKRWVDICSLAVDLIRVGVQVISCLTPPGLGCLWGLVAQLGIGAMVGLVVGTQWFNDKIITPNVRRLIDDYIAPTYQSLINHVLGEGLSEYHCHIADDAIPSLKFEAKGGLSGAALRAHRDSWEKEFEPQIMADFKRVFGSPNGKEVTKEDVQKMLKNIQESGLSMEEFKDRGTVVKLLEQARDPKSGKLDIERAKAEAEKKEEPPPAPAVARKIDYPHARQQNVVFQKMHGWDPTTFIAKPGIKVDSDEFADAVYDMQGKVDVKQDGILGDHSLIAFYDKNKKKKDIFYQESKQAIEERKAAAEKAAREKAEKQAEAEAAKYPVSEGPEYSTLVVGLSPDVKELHAMDCVPDTRDTTIPPGINVDIVDFWSFVEPAPKDEFRFNVKQVPAFVSLDIRVDKKHKFRILKVAVDQLNVSKRVGDTCRWYVSVQLHDGIKVDTAKGPLTLFWTDWCMDPYVANKSG